MEAGESPEIFPRPDGFISTWVVLESTNVDPDGPSGGDPIMPYCYRLGKVCLAEAFGQIFGHSFECQESLGPPTSSIDAHMPAVLWDCARSVVLAKGYDKVIVHFEEDTPARIKEFWIRLGATFKAEMYELDLVNGRGGRVRRLKYRNLHP